MSGLIGVIDNAYHKVKGDQEEAEEKHTLTGKRPFLSYPSPEFTDTT